MSEAKLNPAVSCDASVTRAGGQNESVHAKGVYHVVGRNAAGDIIWEDEVHNTVVDVGKNELLDKFLAGSAFTQTGPIMGLISSVSFSAIASGDTMASHSGWTEAGNANAPTYTAPRKTTASGWSAASGGSKSLSSALTFAFTGSGTVKGCFLVSGSGAVTTIDNTSGILLSAGLFSGGDKTVANGDSISVSFTFTV